MPKTPPKGPNGKVHTTHRPVESVMRRDASGRAMQAPNKKRPPAWLRARRGLGF